MPTPAADPSTNARDADVVVRTFVVDDHPAFLRTAVSVIDASPSFEVVGTATNGRDAIAALTARSDVDLVLLDVNLPDTSGIDVAHHLHDVAVRPGAGAGAVAGAGHGRGVVVLMSTTERHDLRADAFERGVAGFLPKELLSTSSIGRLWREATDVH